ncbi:MAG: pyridoxine 5'-phosphate synthase [Candidatus Cyclobacteriaceae bacterium M3_2C_046]
MTRLSVNINKFATLRNARGGNRPDVVQSALDCEKFGAQGITVHPRPDERHITYADVMALRNVLTTEFNVEGYPDQRYMDILSQVKPAQATLVPDAPDVITSNSGWNTVRSLDFLKEKIKSIHELGIRTSIFVEPQLDMVEAAAKTGTDRIEFYTEHYATAFYKDKDAAIASYIKAAEKAHQLGLVLNAGHDLDLNNLHFLVQKIPYIEEVSIGHAIVCDAIYYGLENTIQMYLRQLK